MSNIDKLMGIAQNAQKIVIVQADNPDADSLGSALALEYIIGDLEKEPYLYCAVDVPGYLRYLDGWDRVENELPKDFDASIIVDCSTLTLLDKAQGNGDLDKLRKKPCVVIDHHATVENPIDFADITINDSTYSSTGELIYVMLGNNGLELKPPTFDYIMTAILGDTQGLSNDLTTSLTYKVMGDMVGKGANRPSLEEKRRIASKMPPEIYKYKSQLIGRTKFELEGKLALVTIPQSEINEYSPLYNPGPLIQGDMLSTEGVAIAVVIKHYDDGKITGSIRANNGSAVAGKLAESLGGGGHDYAAGFKITDGRSLNDVKTEIISKTRELLDRL